MNGRGRSMTSATREVRFCAVIGLARTSVTPASRAASTRARSVFPVTMMMGTNGFGLLARAHHARECDPVHRLHREIGQDQIGLEVAHRGESPGAIRSLERLPDAKRLQKRAQ